MGIETPFEHIHSYISDLTVLQPEGNLVAEVLAATERIKQPHWLRRIYVAVSIGAAVLLFSLVGVYTLGTERLPSAFVSLIPQNLLSFEPSDPEHRLATQHIGPVTLRPGERRDIGLNLVQGGPVDVIMQSIVPDWTGHEQQRTQWELEGRGNTPELFVSICSAREGAACPKENDQWAQLNNAGIFRRELNASPATVSIFNFRENPTVSFTALLRHP